MTCSPDGFPLTAEQIVRGVAYITKLHLDRTARQGDKTIRLDELTIALGRAVGVPLPVKTHPSQRLGAPSRVELLPYGASADPEPAEPHSTASPQPPSPHEGGSRAT